MPLTLTPRLLNGISVYQDVLLAGRVAHRGERDCSRRWQLIDSYLPKSGAILDIGSNFGWFGLNIVQSRPQCLVVSAEADMRSARVQHAVLQSHRANTAVGLTDVERIVLVTRRLTANRMMPWRRSGQQFSAVLCLNVLHWMRDHAALMQSLDAITGRIFVENPDPAEQGAGLERVRREIGPIGEYLSYLFPARAVICLGMLESHRAMAPPRTLWMVDYPPGWMPAAAELDIESLLRLNPVWPPPAAWRPAPSTARNVVSRPLTLTLNGLVGGERSERKSAHVLRRLLQIPSDAPFSKTQLALDRVRRQLRPWLPF
jgi:SAM-dependent methyltransferase